MNDVALTIKHADGTSLQGGDIPVGSKQIVVIEDSGASLLPKLQRGELAGAFLAKGMIIDKGPPKIAKVRNVWTKPHQGAKEIERRRKRMERKQHNLSSGD